MFLYALINLLTVDSLNKSVEYSAIKTTSSVLGIMLKLRSHLTPARETGRVVALLSAKMMSVIASL